MSAINKSSKFDLIASKPTYVIIHTIWLHQFGTDNLVVFDSKYLVTCYFLVTKRFYSFLNNYIVLNDENYHKCAEIWNINPINTRHSTDIWSNNTMTIWQRPVCSTCVISDRNERKIRRSQSQSQIWHLHFLLGCSLDRGCSEPSATISQSRNFDIQ